MHWNRVNGIQGNHCKNITEFADALFWKLAFL